MLLRIIWILVLSSLVAGTPIESSNKNEQLSNGPNLNVKRSIDYSDPNLGGTVYPYRQILTDEQLETYGARSESIRDYPPHGLQNFDITSLSSTPVSSVETEKSQFLSNWNELHNLLQNTHENDNDNDNDIKQATNQDVHNIEDSSENLNLNLDNLNIDKELPAEFAFDSKDTKNIFFVGGKYNISLVLDKGHPILIEISDKKNARKKPIPKFNSNEDPNDFAGPYLPVYDCQCKYKKSKNEIIPYTMILQPNENHTDSFESDNNLLHYDQGKAEHLSDDSSEENSYDTNDEQNLAFIDGQYVRKPSYEFSRNDDEIGEGWREELETITVVDELGEVVTIKKEPIQNNNQQSIQEENIDVKSPIPQRIESNEQSQPNYKQYEQAPIPRDPNGQFIEDQYPRSEFRKLLTFSTGYQYNNRNYQNYPTGYQARPYWPQYNCNKK